MNITGNENELITANNYVTQEQIIRNHWNIINDVPAVFFAKVGAAVMLNRKRLCRNTFLLDNNTMAYMFDKSKWNYNFGKTMFDTIDLTLLAQIGAIPSYNASDVENIEILMPHLKEQDKIGELFTNLDNLITLHQRKFNDILVYKLSTKFLFLKLAKNVWEQRKLNEVTDVRDGTHDSPKYIEFGHPFITSKNVKNGYINYDEIQYISDEDFNEINKRSKVDKNDILFGMIGTIGNIALIRENPDFAIKNVALIKDIKKIDYLYLYQYLQSNNIAKQFDENMDGGTQKFIALNKVRNLSIMYPTISEQIQIGGFLEKLDNLITLHQHKELKRRNDNNEHLRW